MLARLCIIASPNLSLLWTRDGSDAPLESIYVNSLTSFHNKARHIANQCLSFDKNER